jgi:hypothetical protein
MNNKVYTLDCGKNAFTIAYNGDGSKYISRDDFLDLPNEIPPNSLLIAEYAHMGCPRKKHSRSQPFNEDTLKEFYAKCKKNNIELKLFPQMSTPRAISYSNLKKSDINDPISIFNLVKNFPSISLMNPPRGFEPSEKVKEYWNWKDETNKILNFARMENYDFTGENNDQNTKWILDNFKEIYNKLSKDARNCFNIVTYKNEKKGIRVKTKANWLFSMPQLYSVLSVLRDYEGNLRLRSSTGYFPSNYDIKRYIFCMTPFHQRGGVARSNLYHHGLKNFIVRMSKLENLFEDENIINLVGVSALKNHPVNFKRKIKSLAKESEEETMIRRGDFNEVEEKVFLYFRSLYCKSVMEVCSLLKDMLSVQNNLLKPN